MARKLPQLQRALDAPALASVAYGEVASSLYFALGIVALHALGLTPAVLAIVGLLFLVVTLSYAEGTTSIGETGGAATFVRVAFNDLAGLVTGWALVLDYIIVTVLIALVALSAFPAPQGTTQLGTTWQRAPLMGVVYALGPHIAFWVERLLRIYVGLTGALILLTAAATSNSGFGRLAYSLGEHGQLPRNFARLSRRSLHSPETVVAATTISIVLLLSTAFTTNPVGFLASLFSFGVLVAFTAAQLAVVKLRFSKPGMVRPYRVPFSVRVRGADVPVPTVVGALATTAIFVAAMVTHIGARYGGPIWLAAGVVVYLLVRRQR